MSARRAALRVLGTRHLMLGWALGAATILGIAAVAAEPLKFDIAKAEVGYDQRTGEPVVSFRLTPDSAHKFAEFTLRNVGHMMEIRVDGKAYSRPVVREPIVSGFGQISGPLSVPEAKDLAARLSAGTQIEFEAVAD